MEVLIFIAVIFVAVLVTVGPVLFLRLRKRMHADTSFERGLEMVPLLIHIPPQGDDTEANGRDVRDVVDENISRAQIIYNIISSTTEKSFKNRWFGQRHFSFEIIGSRGFVHLYAVVPVEMVDVVKQAIVSAYPAARLEETTEHNIFNPVGKLNATVGGELNLKESFAYPIATYQDLKRDALQSILNALSTLDREDGAAIQLMFRPADSSWRKEASAIASKKRKGKDKSITASMLARDMLTAFVKPPASKDEGQSANHDLSPLEQSVVDSIDDKTRYPGFEVAIRVIASSNISQRAQSILNNVVASFSLFDSPGKNGFKYTPTKDMSELVTAYILRFFPLQKKRNILNAVELATLFHFPDQSNIPTSQLERQESKQVDGPRNAPDEGIMLGYNVFRGVKKPIRLALQDRQRHMYAVGQTGTGKSTFLENLALQDMLSGGGFAFVDPHGDTVENLLAMVPKERTEDVIYFSPSDMDYPMGLNLFEFNSPDQKDFLIQEAINMLYKLYDPQHQGIIGPRYEHLFRNAALTIMADPDGGTFVDIPKLFRDPQYVKQKLQHVTDLNVIEFWEKEMPQSQRSNEFGEVVSWFVSKFGAFTSNEMMRNIIGQTKSSFDLRDVMDNKKILLVNLSKGRLGELNSKLLGMMFVMKFQAAAMSRSNVPEDKRIDFALYVDEFQNFSTDSFATIMSEARKFHLNLIVANQFTTQLTDEIRDAVFGNIGTIVSFRIGQNDVDSLSRYFQPVFSGDDLLRVPNHNTVVRTLIKGVPTQPFSMATLPPLGNPNPGLADALKQLSAAKYGKPKATVEKDIFARLATKAPEPKPFQNPFAQTGQSGNSLASTTQSYPSTSMTGQPTSTGQSSPTSLAPATQQKNPGSGSFLDEWLAKQRATIPAPALNRAPQPLAQVASAPSKTPKSVAAGPLQPSHASTIPVQPVQAMPFTPASRRTTMVEPPKLPPIPSAPDLSTHTATSSEEGTKHLPSTSNPEISYPSEQPAPGNVSSAQLDQAEIDDIARELKRGLGKPGRVNGVEPELATLDVVPVPVDEPIDKESTKEGTIQLTNPGPKPDQTADDTIFIDNEGTLHVHDDASQKSAD